MEKVKLQELMKSMPDPWQPKDLVYVHDIALRMAKIQGAYTWHTHQNEDEFFLVLKGKIFIDTEDSSIELKEHEGYLIERGKRHRSRAEKPAWIMLIEPIRTKTRGEET